MTRREFEEQITDFWELRDFCDNYGLCAMDDLSTGDTCEEYIWDCIRDYWGGWKDLMYDLENVGDIIDDYWYRVDGSFDFTELDEDDFVGYKREAMEEAENAGVFEDEEEETEEEEEESESETVFPEEDFEVSTLLCMCGSALHEIYAQNEADAADDEREFESLFF